ncbi:MAG TPA: hypothetical protein VFA27_04405 [Vicinamibacterales bacterium]|nr:hypothetical protein [Vicinamibacterales bacterium]
MRPAQSAVRSDDRLLAKSFSAMVFTTARGVGSIFANARLDA